MTFWQTQHSPMNQELSQVLQKMAFLLNRRSVPYRRPADTWQERLNLAMEDPGVVAGFSHTENLPVLVGGMALHDDYVWAPLIKTPDGH